MSIQRELPAALQHLPDDQQVVHVLLGCFRGPKRHGVVSENRPRGLRLSRVAENIVASEFLHTVLRFERPRSSHLETEFEGIVVRWSADEEATIGATLSFADYTGDSRPGSHTDYTVAGSADAITPDVLEGLTSSGHAMPDLMRTVFPNADRSKDGVKAREKRDFGAVETHIRKNMGFYSSLL